MEQQSLFGQPSKPPHPYQDVADRLWALAKRGIYLGSSSWKYESWKGVVYVDNYRTKKDFEQNCLKEYATIFPCVGGDFSFYNWPGAEIIAKIDQQTPDGFKIGLKATEFITLKRFPNLSRWGAKAGHDNADFLNAKLFKEKFLDAIAPLEKSRKLSPIILEFTEFRKGAFHDWTEFASQLEGFLVRVRNLVGDRFEFGVEVRTPDYIHGDFFAALHAMGAVPVLTCWTKTPPLDEQWETSEGFGFPCVMSRAVMRPGRAHDEAVLLFEPYDRNKETLPRERQTYVDMIRWALGSGKPAYIFINNHFEGCAHQTIAELSELVV